MNAFCITQNQTPTIKKHSASTNKLSHNFAEHVTYRLCGIFILTVIQTAVREVWIDIGNLWLIWFILSVEWTLQGGGIKLKYLWKYWVSYKVTGRNTGCLIGLQNPYWIFDHPKGLIVHQIDITRSFYKSIKMIYKWNVILN